MLYNPRAKKKAAKAAGKTERTSLQILIFLIVAPFQSRTIIATIIILAGGFSGGGGPSQTRLISVFLIDYLATVLKGRQAGFHVVELRRRDHVLLTCRQNLGNFFLRLGDPIRSLRVR